jgi:hypothetical protein
MILYLPRKIEENHLKTQSGETVAGPRYEPEIFQVGSRLELNKSRLVT